MIECAVEYRVQIAPGLTLWKVGANTVDFIPDHIVMQVANDPLCMAALEMGIPVHFIEDTRKVQ